MTTLTEPRTSQGRGTRGRECAGCPRCQDSDAQFCRQKHPQYNGYHPVCKRCGHCVLRGDHEDDASDLRRDP